MVYKMCNVPNSEWDVELLKEILVQILTQPHILLDDLCASHNLTRTEFL